MSFNFQKLVDIVYLRYCCIFTGGGTL